MFNLPGPRDLQARSKLHHTKFYQPEGFLSPFSFHSRGSKYSHFPFMGQQDLLPASLPCHRSNLWQ